MTAIPLGGPLRTPRTDREAGVAAADRQVEKLIGEVAADADPRGQDGR
jgi:hypothetical protein